MDGREHSLGDVAELVGASAQRDLALGEHHDLVGEGEGLVDVLLDDEQRAAGVADRGQRRLHLVDDHRREAE